MKPDIRSELIPSFDTLRLNRALDSLKDALLSAAHQWQLLDAAGHVPDQPSYSQLLRHAAGAQDLARDVSRLTAGYAGSHHTNRAANAMLSHLATAVTMSSHAATHFAETAETVLSLYRTSNPTDQKHRENRMVIDHATARAYLRRASESVQDAVREMENHLEFHRFFPTASPDAARTSHTHHRTTPRRP